MRAFPILKPTIPVAVLSIAVTLAIYHVVWADAGPCAGRPGNAKQVALMDARINDFEMSTFSTHRRPQLSSRLRPTPAIDLSEDEWAKWTEALRVVHDRKVNTDERDYIRRRLHELEIKVTDVEFEQATNTVLSYMREKAKVWRLVQDSSLHPEAAEDIYARIHREHVASLQKHVSNLDVVRRIVVHLIPNR